jgi:septum formation topological specificity factor MinE
MKLNFIVTLPGNEGSIPTTLLKEEIKAVILNHFPISKEDVSVAIKIEL